MARRLPGKAKKETREQSNNLNKIKMLLNIIFN